MRGPALFPLSGFPSPHTLPPHFPRRVRFVKSRMALALPHILLLWSLRSTGTVGPGKSRSILEFGEQNWYGDVDPVEIRQFLDKLEGQEPAVPELRSRLDQLLAAPRTSQALFDLAKLYYQIIFGEHSYRAVDLHGTAIAEQYDL